MTFAYTQNFCYGLIGLVKIAHLKDVSLFRYYGQGFYLPVGEISDMSGSRSKESILTMAFWPSVEMVRPNIACNMANKSPSSTASSSSPDQLSFSWSTNCNAFHTKTIAYIYRVIFLILSSTN